MTEALTSNYWISPNAVRITLNAMGRKDYIQCGATGGAVIMCYIRDVDGLGYDAGHNYRRWPIVTAPVYFNSWTRKYVYIAIPRSTAVRTSAILVFPSERIDLYGMTEPAEGETEGEQIGSKDYYYIFLRGVISPSRSDGGADQLREWEEYVDYGTLSTDQQVSEGDSEWWRYNADDDTVTFLKVITNATFKVLNVLKNLTVGGDGSFGGSLSVAKDAVVGGLLTAVSAVINSIKSTNYSGSGMADTGWSITNDNGSGSSEAVFDYLTVRKKMTINSLEIKETHFTAGDICQSLATAEIVRTDYYYVDPDSGEMEKLGYSKYRVPWLLKGLALVLGKRAQNMKIFSRWKTVRINLTRNELLRCNRVRCYFLAKDGEREIENWWRENDLARCQTWNMTKAQRNTFIPNFNDHAGNIYWWRTVKNTSWNTGLPRYLLTDDDGNPKDPSEPNSTTTDPDNEKIYRNEAGLKYEVTNGTYNNEKGTQSYKDHQPAVIDGQTYHWIDIAFDGSREIDDNGRLIGNRTGWCDANSDIPAAGDKVVQFGNTVDPDRMNLMLWEVNGSGNMDAPDWKMYAGIYTFDLNLCWWGGTPQKTKWSYRTGIRVYAPKFEWITEYGIAKQAFDRGHWTELPLERDDDTRLHEDDLSYYPEYPDDIKNPDGTFKSRKNGEPRNFIRKCHYYDRVSHEGSMWLCSINETNYWVAKENFTTADNVSYTKGDRISNFSSLSTEDKTHCEQVRNYTFDEPSIASLDWTEVVEKGDDGSFKSRVFCRSNDTPLAPSNEVKTVGGITYNTFNNPLPPPVQGQPTWSDGAPNGSAILWSSTAWFYPNGTHTEWTMPSPETDTADLDIEFSPNYNKPDAPYSGNDFTPDMRGNGTAYGVKDATHSNKRANGSGEDANWYDPTADANNTHADWNDMIWRAERKIKNGEYIGSWSITRIKGEQGDTPVTAYRWYKEEAVATTAPTAPTGESVNPTATDHTSDSKAYPAATWSENAPNRPATGWCLYMTTSYRFDDGTYGQWTTPIRISGTDGTPGEDAENVEWIYKTSPDTNVTIPTNSPNQKGYVPAGWTNHPTGIDATNIYEFACFRILPEGANVDDTKVWSKWMGVLAGAAGDTPIIWSHWGRNGMDGDGFEYVFVRTTTNSAPTIVVKADSYTDSNGHKFTDDEFLPKALVNGTEIECSDEPQSIDPVNKYVWVAKRTKGPANTDTGVRTWEKYSGTMSLWNNWADNAVHIDLDNQADLISLDAEGKVRFARTITTKARIYDGGSVAKSGVTKASSLTEAKLKFGNRQPSISNVVDGVVTITWAFQKGDTITTNTEPKTIELVYKNETYNAVFSLGTTDRDVIYQVLPNPDKVSFSKSSSNALSPASVPLVCDYTKDTGSGTIQTITNVTASKIDDNNYLYYRVKGSNGSWGSWTAYTGAITVLNSTTDTDYEFAISTAATAASVTDSNIYEREVVPIVKDGLDGKSITKSSADTYKYKVSDDGTTTPSGTWYSTKQAAIDAYNTAHSISGHDWKQGTFMWTETTIHWSNNTETILYTNERNSVDGKAGQDIVNGTTIITYCVKDSNSPQPPDSDFHAYNASEVVQGKWLWSKATTPYYKANDLEHPIGYSSNYNISYISEDGADGKDGNGIVSITNTYGISASGKTNSDITAPSDVTTWSAGSPDATTSKPYLWKKEVTVYTDTAKNTTKYYCIGRYGDNGIDAQDVEFVYVRTTHNVAPTIAADTETPQGYKNDDYLPFAKVSSGRIKGVSEANANAAVRCTDDPKGVDNTWKYEWEIKRTKGAAGADGKREWDNYVSGANMTLHNNLAESTLIIDIDNDNDQFGTDSDGRVNSQQTRTTKVTMLYGTEKQAFTSAPTATLKYDDGTPASGNVDITVASVSVTKVTYDNKEYKVIVNINQTASGTANPPFKTHNGLYVDIEGTCAKGGPKTIRFSLEKVMSGEKGSDAVVYQLAPSQRSFSFGRSNTNEIVAKSNTVTVNLKITQGNNSVIYVSPGSIPSGMTVPTISWGFEDEQTATAEHSNLPVGTAISITPAQLTKGSGLHTKVWIKLSTGDREEIPVIIDGGNGQDGAAGRAVISASEHYKVSNNDGSAGHQEAKPIADGQENASLEWETNPNAAIASWGENARYLWNYEKTEYSSGTTPVRTTPRIIAIWTKDGANGKGIDHITNYYKASAKTGIGSDVESYPTTDAEWAAWDDNPVAPTSQNPYLWNFEVIYWVDPTNTTHTTPHVIGHYGQDAEIVTVYQEAESTPAKPTGSTIPPTGWSLTEPRVGYNATEKMDELRLVNTDTDVHTLSRKYIVINNTSAKVKMGIKLVLGGTVYSDSEGVAVYDGNTKVAEQAGRTGTKDNVSIEIAANAKKVYEVRLTRSRSYSAHTIYGCFAFTGGGMNISPMYVWQSHAVFHGTTISDDGWSDPVTYTAKNGDNPDTEKDEYVYVRTTENVTPTITESSSSSQSDDYLPNAKVSSGRIKGNNGTEAGANTNVQCTDDSQGINDTWRYEWEIHRVKTNGVWGAFGDIKIYQSLGEQGHDAVNVIVSPASLIVNQSLDNPSNLSSLTEQFVIQVNKGGVSQTVNSIQFTAESTNSGYKAYFMKSGGTAAGTGTISGNILTLKRIGTYDETVDGVTKTYYYDTAYVDCVVTYNTDKNISVRIPIYANLLGTWKEKVEGDTWNAIAEKTFYYYDSNDDLVKVTTIGEYINSSSTNSSNLKTLLNGIVSDESYIRQTADAINMGVTNGWKNYINDPVAATRVTSTNTDDDSIFGKVAKVATTHTIERASELNEKSVTWFCVVGINANGSLTFGSAGGGASAVQISKNNSGVSVTSVFNNTYAKGATSGCTFVGQSTNGTSWYLCWTNAALAGSLGATNNQAAFGSLPSGWRIYYAGIVMGCGCPSIDMIKQGAGLTKAGIDITQGKITATANTFEIKNNSGTTTFSVDNDGNIVGAGNAKFNGKINATGGNITGELVIGGTSQTNTIKINPSAPSIEGYNGTNRTFNLQAYESYIDPDGNQRYGASLFFNNTSLSNGALYVRDNNDGNTRSVSINVDQLTGTQHPEITLRNTNAQVFKIRLTSNGFTMGPYTGGGVSGSWATESDVSTGYLYKDSQGYLRVK